RPGLSPVAALRYRGDRAPPRGPASSPDGQASAAANCVKPGVRVELRQRVVVLGNMLTVPEAARRAGRDPETIRRWIRLGRLRARKVGTQHVIEEGDLESALDTGAEMLPVPKRWRR